MKIGSVKVAKKSVRLKVERMMEIISFIRCGKMNDILNTMCS